MILISLVLMAALTCSAGVFLAAHYIRGGERR